MLNSVPDFLQLILEIQGGTGRYRKVLASTGAYTGKYRGGYRQVQGQVQSSTGKYRGYRQVQGDTGNYRDGYRQVQVQV